MSTQRTTLSGRDIASGDSNGPPLPPPDDAPHAVRLRETPRHRVLVEVPGPVEGIADRHQLGRWQHGREVEPRLRPAGDRETTVVDRVLVQEVADVHPDSAAAWSLSARRHGHLERPAVRY